jgi:hypothetical protein
MCFRACRHLDNVHSVFAKVVGGMAVLDRIEQEVIIILSNSKTPNSSSLLRIHLSLPHYLFILSQPRDSKTDKPLTDIIITKTEVFADPLTEATSMLEALIKERQDSRLTATSKLTKATGGAAGEAPEREKLRLAAEAAADRKGWHSAPTPVQSSSSTSVGKYMDSQSSSSSSSSSKQARLPGLGEEPIDSAIKKQKVTGTKFKDFSSW